MISIRLDGHTAVEADFRDAPEVTGRAVYRALKRAIGAARTFMVREIAGDTGLKSKDVRDALKLREPQPGNMTAVLSASLKRIPLIKFGATGPEPSRGRGRGVSYRLRGGRSRLPHAFIARMSNGHRGVYMRVTGGRRRGPAPNRSQLPIRQLFGPSLGHVFEKFQAQGQARAIEAFEKNLKHELTFARSQAMTAGGDADAGTD